jgi:hypothetical protein
MYQPFLDFGVHAKRVSKITALGMATAHCNHVGQSSIFVMPLFPALRCYLARVRRVRWVAVIVVQFVMLPSLLKVANHGRGCFLYMRKTVALV